MGGEGELMGVECLLMLWFENKSSSVLVTFVYMRADERK